MHMRRMHISMGIMLKVLLIRALSFPFGNVAIIAQGSVPVNRFLKTPIVFLLYLHFVHVLEKLRPTIANFAHSAYNRERTK